MQTTFNIDEIYNYLISQESRGDIMYNLSAENIIEANIKYPCINLCNCTPEEVLVCHDDIKFPTPPIEENGVVYTPEPTQYLADGVKWYEADPFRTPPSLTSTFPFTITKEDLAASLKEPNDISEWDRDDSYLE